MIKLFRIDERLIHGQVAIKWSKHTGVDRIVVANDAASNSPVVQKALKMAAPSNVKTAIKSIDDAITLLNDPRVDSLKLLVLVASPEDAVKVVTSINGVPFINIGNYGRVALEKPGKPRKRFAGNIYCDEDEVMSFKELIQTGLKCIYQPTPEDRAEDISIFFS